MLPATFGPGFLLDSLRDAARPALAMLLLLAALPVSADTFLVTDTIDAIPAPEGSLRWAIERSEANGEPDLIDFIIDGGTIELIAPLPDLAEGGLTVGRARTSGDPSGGNGIAISGVNGVARAIAILSERNSIAELDFIGFSGPEAILIGGGRARDTVIAGCGFGRDLGGGNAGAGIRIQADVDNLGMPTRTEIRLSRFVNNGAGIVIEGNNAAPSLVQHWTRIYRNGFGTDPLGGPGPGTGVSVQTINAGPVHVVENRLSGPGAAGILLGAGSARSTIFDNRIGLRGPDITSCSGFDNAGLRVEGSAGVRVADNSFSCNDVGIFLANGADDAQLRDNVIGGSTADAQRSHGVVIDSAAGALLRHNRIVRNDGFGVASVPGPVVDPDAGSLLACNSVFDNLLGALSLPDVLLLPPVLTSATPVAVTGDLPDPVTGWVELFGDDADQARVFQGALRLTPDDPPFRHRLPVLGLRVDKTGGGSEIKFDRTTPDNHTATLSDETGHETTELSAALPAPGDGLVFDLIRGRLANLAFAAGGGIDLGPVVCLESGLTPDLVASPDAIDPDVPAPGQGFFYVSRRRHTLENAPGTYDPAICLTDVDRFEGPRAPASGDCPI